MLNYQPTYHDQSIDPLIQQILPDIEQSLKKQLMSELQQQAQLQFQKQLVKMQTQAYEQFEMAVHELEEQGKKLFHQQTENMKKQIQRLKKQKKNKQENHYKHLQDLFISQNFQELILDHPRIQQIQKELGEEILRSSEQKIQSTKQRRLRQIAVKMENKEQKYKKDRDRAIKNQVFQSRSVDEVRKDLQIMKIGIASMKSEYNIKIKKIDSQIKQIKQKNKSLQPKQNIHELRDLLQHLQNKRDQLNEQILYQQQQQQAQQKQKQKQQYNNHNNTFSHLDSEQQCSLQLPPHHMKSIDTMMQRNSAVVEEHDDYESQSQSNQSEEYNNQYLVKAPKYQPSAEVSQQNLETFQNQVPILRLNVASLLRSNWQDPLQKYINPSQKAYQSSTQNQNSNWNVYSVGNNENEQKNINKLSFQQVYHQHLQKLNQATKRRKLSNQAKKTLIKNLSLMGKNKA